MRVALVVPVLLLAGCGGLPDAQPLTASETIGGRAFTVPAPTAHPARAVRQVVDTCRAHHDCSADDPARVRLGMFSGKLAYALVWKGVDCISAGPGTHAPQHCSEYVVVDAGTGATLLHYEESDG